VEKKGKHRKIAKAQVNRRPDLESLPTLQLELVVGSASQIRRRSENGRFRRKISRRESAGGGGSSPLRKGEGEKAKSSNGGTVRLKKKRLPTRAQRLYFGPFLYVSVRESHWAVPCFMLSAHLFCCFIRARPFRPMNL